MARRRPTRRHPSPPTTPLTLEVLERHVYHVANEDVAADIRQALAHGDVERLAELVDALEDVEGGPAERGVLDCREVRR